MNDYSDEKFRKRYLEFSVPFVEGLKNIYSTMLETEVRVGTPKIVNHDKPSGEYTALMGMNGTFESESHTTKFRGYFSICWPLESYLKMASQMLFEDFTEMNEEIVDAGMEVCNMAMGGAKTTLNPRGYKIEMSTPSCIQGENVKLSHRSDTITLWTPLESDLGPIYLELNYKEIDADEAELLEAEKKAS